MNILEIPVIGSRRNEIERFYSLLSDQPLRKFEGLDVGYLHLGNSEAIYFYFLDQEDEDYFYLWDLIIPHAIGCVVLCDMGNTEIFEKNVEIIEHLKSNYNTPLHICSLPVAEAAPPEDTEQEFIYFDPQDKESVKTILLKILDSSEQKDQTP
jgi:hypothetical protein